MKVKAIHLKRKKKTSLQISGETVGELKTVADMHQRKSEMAKHAEAFIALPGDLSYKFPIFLG